MTTFRKSPLGGRPWLAACDQAGILKPTHYGFGTLWLPYDRRGDFSKSFSTMCQEAGFDGSMGWDQVRRGAGYRLGCALADYFFRTPWLAFHCLVIEADLVNMDLHDDDLDLARRKHFTMLLANKLRRAIVNLGHKQEFRVWVSPIPTDYEKAHEAVEVISSNIVAKFSGRKPNLKVTPRAAARTPSLQLCSLLLGAVMDSWSAEHSNEQKRRLSARMADHLGWDHLRHDTMPAERKFNVWKFHDPVREPGRSASTRETRTR